MLEVQEFRDWYSVGDDEDKRYGGEMDMIIENKDSKMLQVFIDSGIELDFFDINNGKSPLNLALKSKDLDIIKLLVEENHTLIFYPDDDVESILGNEKIKASEIELIKLSPIFNVL